MSSTLSPSLVSSPLNILFPASSIPFLTHKKISYLHNTQRHRTEVTAMSGGVGPTGGGGISLPSSTSPPLHPTSKPTTSPRHYHYHLLSFNQLNTQAAMAVLAASTTVPVSDICFALLSLPYLLLLSSLSFPPGPTTPTSTSPIFLGTTRLLLAVYTSAGFLLGVLLPALYILDGLRAGDTAGVAAASPHAFLLAAQVFAEALVAASPRRFSLPMRAFVPILYNSRRMFALVEWVGEELGKRELGGVPRRRVVAGRLLAVVNLVFWGFNLFGFLLPLYLPRVLKRHYCAAAPADDDKKEPEERNKAS